MNLVAYTRTSTSRQETSHEVQEAAIRAYCDAHGHELVGIYHDTHSGKDNLRESFTWQKCVENVWRKRAEGVITYKIDRLARSLLDFAGLLESDLHLISVTEGFDLSTPHGEMMANVLMSFAQYERRMISERTKAALHAKREAGVRLGRPPLHPLPSQEVQSEIKSLSSSGVGMHRICDKLDLPYSVIRRVLN